MLFLNKYLNLTILSAILTMMTGSNALALEKVKTLFGYSTASAVPAPTPALSLAEQLQIAITELQVNMPNDLDLSTLSPAERATIEAIATKIDLLVRNKDFYFILNSQCQNLDSFMAFRFPALQLIKLNKIATVSEYSKKATLTDSIIRNIPGRAFQFDVISSGWALIGINNTDFANLIAENKAQIIAGNQISARCALWRNLIEYRYYTKKPIDEFLTKILDSNILAAVEWYTKNTLLTQTGYQYILDMAQELYCTPKIVQFLQDKLITIVQKQSDAAASKNLQIIKRVMWVLDAQNRKHRKTNSENLSPETLLKLANRYLYEKVLAEYNHDPEQAKAHYRKYSSKLNAELKADIARVYGTSQSRIKSPDAESIGSPSDRSRATSADLISVTASGVTDDTDRSDADSVPELVSEADFGQDGASVTSIAATVTPPPTPVTTDSLGSKKSPTEKVVNGQRWILKPDIYIIAGSKITAGGKWVRASE